MGDVEEGREVEVEEGAEVEMESGRGSGKSVWEVETTGSGNGKRK
jgi:hypothetical protein